MPFSQLLVAPKAAPKSVKIPPAPVKLKPIKRPSDVSPELAKKRRAIGYKPHTPLRQSAKDALQAERNKGLTIEQVADKYGISTGTVQRNTTTPRKNNYAKIDLDLLYTLYVERGYSIPQVLRELDATIKELERAKLNAFNVNTKCGFIEAYQLKHFYPYHDLSRRELVELIKELKNADTASNIHG